MNQEDGNLSYIVPLTTQIESELTCRKQLTLAKLMISKLNMRLTVKNYFLSCPKINDIKESGQQEHICVQFTLTTLSEEIKIEAHFYMLLLTLPS